MCDILRVCGQDRSSNRMVRYAPIPVTPGYLISTRKRTLVQSMALCRESTHNRHSSGLTSTAALRPNRSMLYVLSEPENGRSFMLAPDKSSIEVHWGPTRGVRLALGATSIFHASRFSLTRPS